MPKEEEYLENLLDSISKAREDVDETYRKDSEEAERKAKERAEIGPDDSFMEKSGLSDVSPRISSRSNLKKALSEDDFLSEFESMLDDDSAPDPDIDSIDSHTNTSTDEGDTLPDGEDVSPYFSKIGKPEQKKNDSPKDDLMDDISSIVSNAKEKAGESILHKNDDSRDTGSDKKSVVDSDEEKPILDNIDLDNVDMSDTSAKDVNLMDESGDGSDLSDMLSGDDDLSDIGDLLDADENDTELPESRDSFEESADGVADKAEEAEPAEESADATPEESGKGGFLSGLIAKIRGIFSKKDDDKLSTDDLLNDHSDSPEELADENAEIMANFSDEAAEARPEKKKKEKPAKKKKEKAPKPPKQKKPKPQDNSPVIPGKVIRIFFFLAISIFALAYIGVTLLPKNQQKQTAEEEYTQQDYLDSYMYYASIDKPDDDEKARLKSSRYAASITLKYNSYEKAMERGAYDYALDALIRGYTEYDQNKNKTDKLDIKKYYNDYGTRIIDALHDQFGLSENDAASIASEKSRSGYTKRIDQVLAEKGLSVSA